jgi:hypothetical protein
MLTINILSLLNVSGTDTIKVFFFDWFNHLFTCSDILLITIRQNAFLFMPNYCFGQGLSDLYNNYEDISLFYQYQSLLQQFIHQEISVSDYCTNFRMLASLESFVCGYSIPIDDFSRVSAWHVSSSACGTIHRVVVFPAPLVPCTSFHLCLMICLSVPPGAAGCTSNYLSWELPGYTCT